MTSTIYIEPTLHACTCVTGSRSERCRVHTCCAVYRGRERITLVCTRPRGHDGAHQVS